MWFKTLFRAATRTVFQQRNRPLTTDKERRAALASLAEENPVLCTLRDVIDEQTIAATGAAAERTAAGFEAGYLAATLDLRTTLEQLRRSSPEQ